ncbi:NCX-6 protein, partial [Aphelenchoides avenae]
RCNYVIDLEEECEGGGYVLWTRFVICQEADVVEGLVIALGVAVLAYLFLALSTVADEFFSRSISAIVDHLRISQNIAGVTFMAFGNGAPDIFSTIVSMVSTETPRANLAIGQMLGGGMFVTTCVVASIVLTNPFKVMRRPILRDLLFYLVALGIMASVLATGKLQVWQPAAFLGLYLLYASTVILGKVWSHRCEKRKVHVGVQDVEATRIDKKKSASFHGYTKERPTTLDLKATTSFPLGKSTTGTSLAVPTYPLDRSRAASLAASDLHRHCSIRRLSNNITIVPVGGSTPHHHTYLTHGKFFTDDDTEEEETVVENAEVSPDGERTLSTISEGLHVVTDMEDSSNECPTKADVSPTDSNHTDSTDCNLRDTSGYFGFIRCLLHHFALWTPKEMEEMPWASKIIAVLQA